MCVCVPSGSRAGIVFVPCSLCYTGTEYRIPKSAGARSWGSRGAAAARRGAAHACHEIHVQWLGSVT